MTANGKAWSIAPLLAALFCFLTRSSAAHIGIADKDLEEYCAVAPKVHHETIIEEIMRNYSRSQSPSKKPVPVKVEVTVQDISELSVLSNSFTADLWFSSLWQDQRLSFGHLDPCRQNLSFDDSFEGRIWSPNVCIVNTKSSKVHISPKPNVLLMLMQNGTVWLNYRVRVEAPCVYQLSDFPMDKIVCTWVLESYSYNTATVQVDWLEPAVTLTTTEFSASDYSFVGVKHAKVIEYYKAGEWYRLTVDIQFERRYGFYILQIYIPSYIYVLISFITFVIELKALPARVILTVNTLMSLCLQFGNIIGSLPPVSYVKSIDYFMFTCIAFIFASTVELAFIAYQDKKLVMRALRFDWSLKSLLSCQCVRVDPQELEDQEDEDMYQLRELQKKMRNRKWRWRKHLFLDRGSRIDKLSFIMFPSAFLAFNLIYWGFYLTKTKTDDF